MRWAIKIIILFVLLALAARGYEYLRDQRIAEEKSPDHEMDAVDTVLGRGQLKMLQDIKEKSPQFNKPALKTALSQFYIDKGRYPRTLAELENANLVGRDLTRDRFGQPFELKYENRSAILISPGQDKQKGTEDDIRLSVPLQ